MPSSRSGQLRGMIGRQTQEEDVLFVRATGAHCKTRSVVDSETNARWKPMRCADLLRRIVQLPGQGDRPFDDGDGEFVRFFASVRKADRDCNIEPPASPYAIMRRAYPYRGENSGPGKDDRWRA
jgi:hypothetical protein